MTVLRLNRASAGFYDIMGPIFGSRIVERATRDRFYDDPDKLWYCLPGEGAASLRRGSVRNFWASSEGAARRLIEALMEDNARIEGVIPIPYAQEFERAGFDVRPYRVNFVEVEYPCRAR